MDQDNFKEEKKKRGRPKGTKKIEENKVNISEDTSKITMSEKEQIIVEKNDFTVLDVQQRLSSVFKNYVTNGGNASTFQNTLSDIYTSNPFVQNQRVKTISSNISTKEKKDIANALLDPQNNEQVFREQSMALFFQNYVYGNLLRLNREVPQFFNYIIPVGVSKEDLAKDKFIKEKRFVNKFISKLNPTLLFKNISLQVSQEGKATYVFRSSFNKSKEVVDFALLQKLPSDYIKYVGFGSESPLICSFNFLMFLNPVYNISDYPPWFEEIWNDLNNTGIISKNKKDQSIFKPNNKIKPDHIIEHNAGGYAYWVTLPQDLVITFGSDLSHALQLPEFIGMFTDLKDLESYKWLQAQTMLTNITNILTAEVEMAKDAGVGKDSTLLSVDTILGLQDTCTSALNSNVLSFFAPLKNFELHALEHIPNAMNISLDELRNVISTSGNSALINTSEKPSIAMIKGSQNIQESKNNFLTLQFETFVNNILNSQLELNYQYKFFLWGGVFSYKDDLKIMKEMLLAGVKGILPRLLSVYNLTVEDYKCTTDYLDVLDIEIIQDATKVAQEELSKQNKIKKVQEEEKKVGRTEIDENDIENDNTAISKDEGNNVSEIKDFATKCIKCGKTLEEEEEFVCNECLEELYDERIE